MHQVLDFTRSKQAAVVSLLREMVECESPSDDPQAVGRFVELLASRVHPMARATKFSGGRFGPHLRCEFAFPGAREDGWILVLGHSDTVWPLGAIRRMPFRESDGRLWGPGVLDMKAGLAFFLFATEAIAELGLRVQRKIVLQANSDEEVGSDSSRALTEEAARHSAAVLVLEPGTGLSGKLKTARKGVGGYLVRVHGQASHAGVDFSAGASAVLELARQIERIAAFTDLSRGITVNPGVIRGGSRSNVVAAQAEVEVDIRVASMDDVPGLDQKFRSLQPVDPRCRIDVEGGLNRPPMERSAGVQRLFQTARGLAEELGVDLEESATGGGSDGNFTAAMGVPTLDGLGAAGEGAHAENESILVDRIADRTALLALLLSAL